MREDLLRALPQVEEVLKDARIIELIERVPRDMVVSSIRTTINEVRQRILSGESIEANCSDIAASAQLRTLALEKPSLRRAINASGVIIHTNLGRSVLAPSAAHAVSDVACGYSTLEYDTEQMARGSRHDHCEKLICALTGAEAAIAVNNNAAAVLMVLMEFAAEHEAIVSRGELVEIGGSFRIPDIMALSHAHMTEIGTTNKTHVSDYARAITPRTAMLLKVHPSNYRMIGFTEQVSLRDLRKLADEENARRINEANRERENSAGQTGEQRANDSGTSNGGHKGHENGAHSSQNSLREAPLEVLVYEDQGSGAFARMSCFGDYAEPTVAESLRAGCDLVSFSGDKLLGGPQAGIIVGAKRSIDRLKKNPLARVLRLDKLTLAALEATLRLYLHPEAALQEIPTLRMLTEDKETVRVRANSLLSALSSALTTDCVELSIVEEISRAGGGALPMCDIPTFAVQISFLRGDALSCERYLVSKRAVPIVGRLKKEMLLFDARTLLSDDEIAEISCGMREYFEGVAS